MKHFIPIVNDVQNLLPKALKGCESIWDRTIIIDNRDTKEELKVDLKSIVPSFVKIHTPEIPLTTAQTMNLMLKLSDSLSFFTWQHLDGVCLEDSAIKLYDIVTDLENNNKKWGVVFTNYDVYAAYNVKALKEINGWDWKRFPYYFLDNDIHHALKNHGYSLIKSKLPVEHKGSSTINFDEERKNINHVIFEASKKLYIQKWGGEPTNETIFTPKKFNKIFQIGFNKCGTTSIHKFFVANDLESIHWGDSFLAKQIVQNVKENKNPLFKYENYDCYTDMESSDDNIFIYLTHYKLLDKKYPGSKFILNIRDVEKWIESRLNHPGYLQSHMNITGLSREGVIEHWKKSWYKHLQEVVDYFQNRENDFLIFNIETEGYKLIDFMSNFVNLKDPLFGHFHKTKK
jgi:hypothetical protein